eukprot:g4439.t1
MSLPRVFNDMAYTKGGGAAFARTHHDSGCVRNLLQQTPRTSTSPRRNVAAVPVVKSSFGIHSLRHVRQAGTPPKVTPRSPAQPQPRVSQFPQSPRFTSPAQPQSPRRGFVHSKPWINSSSEMRHLVQQQQQQQQQQRSSSDGQALIGKRRLRRKYKHEGADGHVCKWSVSGDNPSFILRAQGDKGSIIKPRELLRGKDVVNHFYHEGYDGHVTDWSVSGENPDFILRAQRDQSSILRKKGPPRVRALRRPPMGVQRKVPRRRRDPAHHSSYECSTTTWTQSQSRGIRSDTAHGDTVVSGDAPTWMTQSTCRTHGGSSGIYNRPERDLTFYNRKQFARSLNPGTSKDAPRWMAK